MSTLTIEIENPSDKMWYEERRPEQKKQKVKTPQDKVKLKWNSGMQFVFYSEGNNHPKTPAKYKYLKIQQDPNLKLPLNFNISIKQDDDKKELITEITWPNHVKQKSKTLPPENVSVGVKE